MAKIAGELTILSEQQPPSFVVADSTFILRVKDWKNWKENICPSTKSIKLMELSDAAWSIAFSKLGTSIYFDVSVVNFPVEIKSKSKAAFSVSCDGQDVALYLNSGAPDSQIGLSTPDSQTTYYIYNVGPFVKDNKITLSCRLLITSEGSSSLRNKFYDPQVPKSSTLARYAGMLEDPTFSDFTFVVGGQEFKVHMTILAAASPVMKKLFTTDLEEAKTRTCTVDAIDPEIFGQMLRFVYSGDIPEDLQATAMPLYEAAHYYEIESLEAICVQEIRCSLSPDNALEVFTWPYDLEDLKMEAWKIIKRDILKIFVDLKTEPLPLEKIKKIIKKREQDKKFWMELEEEVVKKVVKTS